RRLRALAEPVLDLLFVELDRGRIRLRVVAPHDLDELAVARRARVGDDDAVDRILLRPDARQTHLHSHSATSWISIASSSCSTSSSWLPRPGIIFRIPCIGPIRRSIL